MVSDKVFANFLADLDPAAVPRRFVSAVIYAFEGGNEWFYMRGEHDIDDFLDMHPRFDGLVGKGVVLDHERLRYELELEFEHLMMAAWR